MVANYINPILINDFFDGLNKANVSYVLIKNIDNELPEKLKAGKDIDILVEKSSMKTFRTYMRMKARKIIHPYGKEMGWRNIYGLEDFEFWRLKTYDDVFVDVSNKLCCHSLMPQIWIPLDNKIQEDIWKNKVFDKQNKWWRIDDNVLYIYLVVRCVFDKKIFPDIYKLEIEKKKNIVDMNIVRSYFKVIFFSFTDKLMEMLDHREYDLIVETYIKYKNY